MKRALAILVLSILCVGSATIARAACVGPSVNSFGAKGDGKTDDTGAIQAAINAVSSAGGGSVVFNVARYYTTGTLIVPGRVILCGAVEGPFDVAGVNPATTTIAPTILITNTSGTFLTLQDNIGVGGTGVTDLLFHYPNQVASSGATPTVYPSTIVMTNSGKIARCTVTNAYNFLDIEVGSVIAQDLFIGAFHYGIYVDHTYDHVTLRNITNQVFWDILENATYPRPIDAWVLANGTGLFVGRADALEVHNFYVFSRNTGIIQTDSPDTTLSVRCGTDAGSDIDLENVAYGIVATCTWAPAGDTFSNVDVVAAPGLGQAAVQVRAGGSRPPQILVNGGSQVGPWALGAYPPAPVGYLSVVNILQ